MARGNQYSYTDEFREAVVQCYLTSYSVKKTSEKMGVCQSTIRRWTNAVGVHKDERVRPVREDLDLIEALYDGGLTIKEIAKKFEISEARVKICVK